MTYEESYKFASNVVEEFLQEESKVDESYGIQLYSDESQSYTLFVSMYPNLFIKEWRDKLTSILNNPIREQLLKRIRDKQMLIISLTGIGFVDTLTNNLIDAIWYNAPNRSRALRRELVRYFDENPFVWFCALVSNAYMKHVIERLRAKAHAKQLPGKQPSAHTIV